METFSRLETSHSGSAAYRQEWSVCEFAREPNARERITLRTPSVRAAIRSRRFSSVTRSRKWHRSASESEDIFLAELLTGLSRQTKRQETWSIWQVAVPISRYAAACKAPRLCTSAPNSTTKSVMPAFIDRKH